MNRVRKSQQIVMMQINQHSNKLLQNTSILSSYNAQDIYDKSAPKFSSSRRSMSTQFEQQADEKSKSDRMTKVLIDVIDAKPRKAAKPTKEEAERRHRIGRNYVIGNFKRHNEINHDLACKIKLKNHAIRLLPKKDDPKFGYLKMAAMEIDMGEDATPPYSRPIPMDTPPIPDFDPSRFMVEEED